MSIESPSPDADQARRDHVQRLEHAMEQLDANIARLALALGVSLDSRQALLEALRDKHDHAPGRSYEARRGNRLRARLRGLMALRYDLIRSCIEDLGPQAAYRIIVDAGTQLLAQGFKPGADGIDLDQLLRE